MDEEGNEISSGKSKTTPADPQLWHACAGPLVHLPPANSTVFYVPRGHADHANCPDDFPLPAVPGLILCRVAAVELLADTETDEVFARMNLAPLTALPSDGGEEGVVAERESVFASAKVLTQSDANNGGGFSVPKQCAEKIFPPLNYQVDPPVQDLLSADVHGKVWRFRHIFRGTPRRHLFTSGWSKFVNAKGLVAGDSLVFVKSPPEAGHAVRVGIRRDKRRLRAEKSKSLARVRAEDVANAVALAAEGRPFEVVYDPCSRSGEVAEFVVRAAAVREALDRVPALLAGIRFSMAFEDDDDPSQTKSCQGTIVSVDPTRWPNSPWKSLQVEWDESDAKPKNTVTHVSPWQIEIQSNILPPIFSSASPAKKQRVSFATATASAPAPPLSPPPPAMHDNGHVALIMPQLDHLNACSGNKWLTGTCLVANGGSCGNGGFSQLLAGVEKSNRNIENLLSDGSNTTTTKTIKLLGKELVVNVSNSNDDHWKQGSRMEPDIDTNFGLNSHGSDVRTIDKVKWGESADQKTERPWLQIEVESNMPPTVNLSTPVSTSSPRKKRLIDAAQLGCQSLVQPQTHGSYTSTATMTKLLSTQEIVNVANDKQNVQRGSVINSSTSSPIIVRDIDSNLAMDRNDNGNSDECI